MVGDGPQNGPAVKAIRKQAGRTQEEIAEAAGIDQSYLSLIESEARPATDRVIDAIAAALDVPLDALLRKPRVPAVCEMST
jgi:transcriptional regulator with XRE-family HTH domain